jgi:hypothetical protein
MNAIVVAYAMSLLPNQLPVKAEDQIRYVVKNLQPALTESEAKDLAFHIHRQAKKNRLDWKLMVSLFNQESSLKKNPQNCLTKTENCEDYGVAQINFRTWGETLHLDKKKLVSSYGYSVSKATQILVSYRKQYSKKDPQWYGCYHSVNPEFKDVYLKRVNIHYGKIKKLLGNYKYEQARKQSHNDSYVGQNQSVLSFGDTRRIYVYDRPRRRAGLKA